MRERLTKTTEMRPPEAKTLNEVERWQLAVDLVAAHQDQLSPQVRRHLAILKLRSPQGDGIEYPPNSAS